MWWKSGEKTGQGIRLELFTPCLLEYRDIAIRATKRNSINLFTDKEFRGLQNLCDSLCNELNSCGIGAEVRKTQPITSQDEEQLREMGILASSTPQTLLNYVFFYNGKTFAYGVGKSTES